MSDAGGRVEPAGGGRRRMTVQRPEFTDDQDVEDEDDEWHDEEDGQL